MPFENCRVIVPDVREGLRFDLSVCPKSIPQWCRPDHELAMQ